VFTDKRGRVTVSEVTLAADFLSTPKAFTMGSGMRSRSPPMSKFWRDRWALSGPVPAIIFFKKKR